MTPEGLSPAPTAPAHILVVDDDPLISELVVDMLAMEGHEVDTASNGVEALGKLQNQRYDLIVTDLHMPKLDGSGFYRELLNTDAKIYGGSNVGNSGGVHAQPVPHHGQPHRLALTLPPLATAVFKPSAG